jgi:hypothetical protein
MKNIEISILYEEMTQPSKTCTTWLGGGGLPAEASGEGGLPAGASGEGGLPAGASGEGGLRESKKVMYRWIFLMRQLVAPAHRIGQHRERP